MYARWIVANGAGEMLGIGTTFVLGAALAPALAGASGVAETVSTAALAVALGVQLEGGRGWPWANALAWAVGMPLVFASMDRVPWTGPALLRVAAVHLVCLVAGLAVGAVHGALLVRWIRRAAA